MLPVRTSYIDGGDGWRLLEVKSSTSVKDYQRDDLAIQIYLAHCMDVRLVSAGIAHIDNSFVYHGDGDYRGLFLEEDPFIVKDYYFDDSEVEQWIKESRDVVDLAVEPEMPIGPQCSDPFPCPFADYCGRDETKTDFPLSSLPRLNPARRALIEAFGINDLRDAPDLLLTDQQRHVRDVTNSGETWFDAEGAAATLAGHGFPAYFLDFETVMLPVPRWENTRPFQQIPFQFSLHRVAADGGLNHEAFLDLSGSDPTRPLAEALLRNVGNEGPVFVYNAGFERRVIRELGLRFQDLAGSLAALSMRIVDLLPIARAHFYDPSQHGSWSLKAVLPAACPDLTYEELEGVADGEMAVDAYREAIAAETTQERRAELERQLLAYCHLDTLAMVRLWEKFRGKG